MRALEKEGVTILEPEDPQAWSQAMEPVYRKYGGEYLDLIEKNPADTIDTYTMTGGRPRWQQDL